MSNKASDLRSPLTEFLSSVESARLANEPGIVIWEQSYLGHLNLRGDPSDIDFLKAVESVIGFTLPLKPNTIADNDQFTVFWLGPNEWLLITPPKLGKKIEGEMNRVFQDIFASITDISGGQTIITIGGDKARNVLAKGCTLDLHPNLFNSSQCAQTLISKVNVIIRYSDSTASFDLIVRRSFADYLGTWLYDASLEYGISTIDN